MVNRVRGMTGGFGDGRKTTTPKFVDGKWLNKVRGYFKTTTIIYGIPLLIYTIDDLFNT